MKLLSLIKPSLTKIDLGSQNEQIYQMVNDFRRGIFFDSFFTMVQEFFNN